MDQNLLHSGIPYTDEDEKNLRKLLEAFGSSVSLEDIASVYCDTGRNLHSTAEMLCNIQGDVAGTSSAKPQDNVENISSASPVCLSNNISENVQIANSKPKKCSATVGTVSSVIGKDYINPKPQKTGLNNKSKPMKLHAQEFPVSEIWEEKNADATRAEPMDKDIQDFIFQMLGNGFQLDKSVIQDVVGQCGYDVPMSIDRLLDLSAATLRESDDVTGISTGNVKPAAGRLETDVNNGTISPQTETKNKSIEREVLNSLFCVPERIEDRPFTRPVRPVGRSPYGQIVAKPPKETLIEDFTFITRQPVNGKNDEEDQITYEEFRKVASEQADLMKECYKAAVDAYIKKDYENVEKLTEQGNCYMANARDAREKSTKKLTEDSDEEEITLNMHYLGPKEALHQMKLNLTSFSGLPSVRCLKVVVGTNAGDAKDRRRKLLITRLLEKEGIPWTEEGNGWTIGINVKEIDATKLNFANNE